jgi:hypothetical protein
MNFLLIRKFTEYSSSFEKIGANYFASNPLRPADGTANETSQEPDWSSVSVCEKLFGFHYD